MYFENQFRALTPTFLLSISDCQRWITMANKNDKIDTNLLRHSRSLLGCSFFFSLVSMENDGILHLSYLTNISLNAFFSIFDVFLSGSLSIVVILRHSLTVAGTYSNWGRRWLFQCYCSLLTEVNVTLSFRRTETSSIKKNKLSLDPKE